MSIKQGNNYIASGGSGIVDQTYSATSTNAQSGTAVAGAISGKANDSDVVKLTGDQTIAGVKTFTYNPQLTDGIGMLIGSNSKIRQTSNGTVYITNAAMDGYIDVCVKTQGTTDNSTKIATTAFVKNQGYSNISSIFPVGSCYITIGNTNPNTILGVGTWTLVTSSIITSVNTNVPVKGTGQGILVTNNNSEYRNLTTSGGQGICMGSNNRTSNVNIGTYDQAQTSYNSDKVIGLTTDASKSGIVGTVTRTSTTLYIWQRTA